MVISGDNLVVNGTTVEQADLINISTITSNIQTQLDGKQATLVSGTNIKTINGSSLIASGDIAVGNLSDAAHSFSGNGYQKLSNGLILQWGYGNGTVTLPIAFPNAAVTVLASKDINADNYSTVYSLTKTSFGIRNGSAWWIAIGY